MPGTRPRPIPSPCSAYLDACSWEQLPRAAGSSSSGGHEDGDGQGSTFPPRCSSWWAWAGGAGTGLVGLAKSRLTWSGSGVAQGEGHMDTRHTTLTMTLPCPRNTGFCTSGRHTCNKSGMFGMHWACCAEQLCPTSLWLWYFLHIPDLVRLHCTIHLQHQPGPQCQPAQGPGESSCPCLCSALKYIVPCPGALNGENPDAAACHVSRPGGGHLTSQMYRNAVAEDFPHKMGGRKVVARHSVFPGLHQQSDSCKICHFRLNLRSKALLQP